MTQLSLLPILLVDEQPADRSKSKDLLAIGFDEQGRRYALKTVEPSMPLLPLTEWICYHLCNLLGIATPDFNVVTRIDGSMAFGSRWEENASEFSPANITEAQLTNWLSSARNDVSGMFALDAFMPNEDRHFANMLFVQTGPRLRAMAFDWSRTRIFEPWPWPLGCNSSAAWAWLRSIGIADPTVMSARMERIKSIGASQVLTILQSAPESWRDKIDIEAAAEWWDANRDKRASDAIKLLVP